MIDGAADAGKDEAAAADKTACRGVRYKQFVMVNNCGYCSIISVMTLGMGGVVVGGEGGVVVPLRVPRICGRW